MKNAGFQYDILSSYSPPTAFALDHNSDIHPGDGKANTIEPVAT